MKILVVGIVENPHMDRLWEEGYKRGHNIVGCYTTELTINTSKNEFNPTLRGKKLSDFDLVYLWTLGKRRWEWISVCRFLHEKFGTIIVNKSVLGKDFFYNPSAVGEFLLQSRNNIPFPKTSVIFSKRSLESVIDGYNFPLIVKSGESRKGREVFLANNKDEVYRLVDNLEEKGKPILIREFITNDGDVRVFCIGYRAYAAMRRVAPKGDFRTNISVGGRGEPFDLEKSPEIKEIAELSSKVLGVEIAGVDIITHKDTKETFVLEVNPGPQFLGIESSTKVNIALKIIEYFEKLYKDKNKASF